MGSAVKRARLVSLPADVYRCYDADGSLLYVGCSVSAYRRIEQHRGAPWFGDLATFTVDRYSTRAEALSVEARAIAEEHPAYNVMTPWRSRDAYVDAAPIESDRFVLAEVGRY